jgi:S1-C subfamily serine protease
VVRPHLVVTAAHVVAGGHGLQAGGHSAQALLVDRRNDIAILRVPALHAQPLPLSDPHAGATVAILGYPENGPFDARPGVIGSTSDVLVNGNLREITAVSGLVRHGNSGGPAVDAEGRVEAMIFAARIGSRAGYGIPAAPIRADLRKARTPVSTGSC